MHATYQYLLFDIDSLKSNLQIVIDIQQNWYECGLKESP